MKSISSFDVKALVKENKELEGKYLEKIQQIGPEIFKLSFQEKDILMEIGKRFNVTGYKFKAPEKPSNAAMILRKYLSNKKLRKIEQYDFDRVITLCFDDFFLVAEFFSHGNLVLTDKDFKIIFTFRKEEWKDRKIMRGEKYRYPKSKIDPITTSEKDFSLIFTEKDVVRSLAKNLNLGGPYAEEICALACVQKNKEKPSKEDIRKLFSSMKKILDFKVSPVMQNNEIHPFPLSFFPVQKKYKTMNEAVDEFFLLKKKESKRLEKLKRRLEKQLESLKEIEKKAALEKEKADRIYEKYSEIERMIKGKKGKIVLELD